MDLGFISVVQFNVNVEFFILSEEISNKSLFVLNSHWSNKTPFIANEINFNSFPFKTRAECLSPFLTIRFILISEFTIVFSGSSLKYRYTCSNSNSGFL